MKAWHHSIDKFKATQCKHPFAMPDPVSLARFDDISGEKMVISDMIMQDYRISKSILDKIRRA